MIEEIINYTRNGILLAALVVAIRFWKYYKNTSERYFLHFLAYNAFTEFLGWGFKDMFGMENYILYNIYMIVSFLFYLYWFQRILKNKLLVYLLTAFFMIAALYSTVAENAFEALFNYAFIAGIICIISLTLYYFIRALQSEQITIFLKDSKFWIVTGLFLFHLGFLPTLLLQGKLDIFGIRYYSVITFLNTVLYGCYIKAFLCSKSVKE
jgi:hypothetical protein